MNYWNCFFLFIFGLAIACIFIAFFLKAKKQTEYTEIPSDAIPVMGNNFVYMWLWKKQNRINFVFSNHPGVTISFDEKIKNNLIESLKKIQ